MFGILNIFLFSALVCILQCKNRNTFYAHDSSSFYHIMYNVECNSGEELTIYISKVIYEHLEYPRASTHLTSTSQTEWQESRNRLVDYQAASRRVSNM